MVFPQKVCQAKCLPPCQCVFVTVGTSLMALCFFLGKTISFGALQARYVRYYSSRNSRTTGVHFLELEVWTISNVTSVTDCKCVAGTFLVANLSVPFGGSGYCQPCPVHTLSPSGSTQPTGVPSTHSLFLSLSLLCLLAWARVPIAAIIAVDEGLLGMCSQSIAYSKRLIIKHPLKPNLSLMPHFQIAS